MCTCTLIYTVVVDVHTVYERRRYLNAFAGVRAQGAATQYD